MILHQAQKSIASDTHRFRVVCAGRRFGKTILAGEEILGKAIFKDNQSIAYIAPTYRQARDIMWEHMKKRYHPIIKNINEARLEIELRTKNGGVSKVTLRGWESVESLRGQQFDFIVMDEVAMFRNFWVGWHEVLQPTLLDNRGESLFISTPKGYNHFFDLYDLENRDDTYKSFRYTTYDNPFMDKVDVDRAKKEVGEIRFGQEYLADFRKTEGLVYKEFHRSLHVYGKNELQPDSVEVLEGLDFGWKNAMASITIKRGRDGVFRIDDEWYHTEKITKDLVEEHLRVTRPYSIYPDPAEPDRIEEIRRAGFRCVDVKKGKDSIIDGIESVRLLLQQNRLMINERCQNTIAEFESYCYPDRKDTGNENELPLDENNHAMDAIRYVIYTASGIMGDKTGRASSENKDFKEMLKRKHQRQGKRRENVFIK